MRLELEPTTSAMPVSNDAAQNGDRQNVSSEAYEILQAGIKAAQAGNRVLARTSLLRAAELDPSSENAWLWLASISEYPEELLAFLKNVLEINPANERAIEWNAATQSLLAKTLVQRGIDAAEEKQPEYAAQCFNQALEYDGQNSMAWLWLASLCDSSEGKITHLESLLSFDPENEEALTAIKSAREQIHETRLADAKAAAVSGRKDEAMEMLDLILGDTPGSEDAWILRSHLTESFEEKIKCHDRVLEINPDNLTVRTSRESLLSIIGTLSKPETVQDSVTDEPAGNEAPAPGILYFEEPAIDKNPTQELEMPEAAASEISAIFTGQEATHETHNYESNEVDEITQEPFSSFAEETQEPVEEPFANFTEPEVESDTEAEFRTSDPAETIETAKPDSGDQPEEEVITEADSFEPEPVVDEIDVKDLFGLETAMSEAEPQYLFEESEEPGSYDAIRMPDTLVVDPAEPTRVGHEPLFVRNEYNGEAQPERSACPFCKVENDALAISCCSCMAILTLSDLEMLLSNQNADKQMLRFAVEAMESDRVSIPLSEYELTMLGIAHLNLRNLESGYSCLSEASKLNPNNIVLSSQVNALLIRLEEIKKRDEAHGNMPKGKTILVVDDSATVRKLITGKLEKCGHNVFCSSDGAEAMERLADLVPDLVLLDITMPEMDGYLVCEMIRNIEATKDVPVVMISGKDGLFDEARGEMAGSSGFITKPFGPETLMKTVETYLKNEVPAIAE